MPMPETPVHKEHRVVFWNHEIRASAQLAIMQVISKPTCMQTAPYQQLWLCVFTPDRSHVAAEGLPVMDVSRLAGPSPCQMT